MSIDKQNRGTLGLLANPDKKGLKIDFTTAIPLGDKSKMGRKE